MKMFNDCRFGTIELPEVMKAHASGMAAVVCYTNRSGGWESAGSDSGTRVRVFKYQDGGSRT